ncbi:hypothetical protein TNCV_3857801 [Trichonephila clavipes]|nr:hypothetical protein TNCV_3857801 [Trichonephila clavipes]
MDVQCCTNFTNYIILAELVIYEKQSFSHGREAILPFNIRKEHNPKPDGNDTKPVTNGSKFDRWSAVPSANSRQEAFYGVWNKF